MGALGNINTTTSVYTASETDIELQNSSKFSGTASGTNTYTISFTPAVTSYVSGQRFFVKFTNANTAAATININGLGAKDLTKNGTTALASGDISANQVYVISYDGTQFQILGRITAASGPTVASVAQLNTGTNNTEFASALGLEGSKYLNQNGTKLSATASGTNTYTATITPAITAYTNTQRFFIKFTNANTGACTLNLNGLGAKSIVINANQPLTIGDISAGQILCLAYDGTNFQLIGRTYSRGSLFRAGNTGAFIPGYAGIARTYAYVGGLATSVHLGKGANQTATRTYQFKLPNDFVAFEALVVGTYRFNATDSMTVTLKKIPAFPHAAGAAGTNDAGITAQDVLPVANDTHEMFSFVPSGTYTAGDMVAVMFDSKVDSGEYAEISFVELKYHAK